MKWRRHLGPALFTIATIFWWLYVAEWIDKPGTYRLVLLYLALGIAVAPIHIYATIRFNRMVRNIRKDEALGLAEPGSTMFAINQRFRYISRTVEAMFIIAVSILGILAISNLGVRTSHNYIRLVVSYLVGSVALTGYLTYRDLRVINFVKRQAEDDAATLRPVLRYRTHITKQEKETEDGSKP